MSDLLYPYQREALEKMHNGCILCGGVGSGKSRTALAYWFEKVNDGIFDDEKFRMIDAIHHKELFIITTAKKRDSHEWQQELMPFGTYDLEYDGYLLVVIDSWNNIKNYADVQGAFFIFDEQRVVGKGAWVKAFLKITRRNQWILLSATPGDTWSDYVPVFVANGYFKNRTEFTTKHVIYSRFTKYPKIDGYLREGELIKYRREVLVDMDYRKKTETHDIVVDCPYDKELYKSILRSRWSPYKNEPIVNASELCYTLRRAVNENEGRLSRFMDICKEHPKVIVFYNFDYELDILEKACQSCGFRYSQWNGHKHQGIPCSDSWVYLVQYNSGAEGWNCTETDTMIFYSQNYSYKVLAQAKGRIDRVNTGYSDLYYYHLRSNSSIDLAIRKAVLDKKKFNEHGWVYNKKF